VMRPSIQTARSELLKLRCGGQLLTVRASNRTKPVWNCMNHSRTQIVPGIHGIVRGWRTVLDRYSSAVMFGEIYAPTRTVRSPLPILPPTSECKILCVRASEIATCVCVYVCAAQVMSFYGTEAEPEFHVSTASPSPYSGYSCSEESPWTAVLKPTYKPTCTGALQLWAHRQRVRLATESG
jgi:hypothetical protein